MDRDETRAITIALLLFVLSNLVACRDEAQVSTALRNMTPAVSPVSTRTPASTATAPVATTHRNQDGRPMGRFLLPTRGLYVQFERRGWASGYWSGDLIRDLDAFDQVVGTTRAKEVERQLDAMRAMGINAITFELRTSSDSSVPEFTFPECIISPSTGLRWPEPTGIELRNLVSLFDLVHGRGMRVMLRLVNTHMDEEPPVHSATWLGSILGAIKEHPALDLILFEGNTRVTDTDGDGKPDACGVPAEPPLWLGPEAQPARYIKWAIRFARSMGMPTRKLSAQAVVGNFFVNNLSPSGPDATDRHLWVPISVLKTILDELGIPDDQRTYALSFYEHRKCLDNQGDPCIDEDPHRWAAHTLEQVFAIIGAGSGARVVAPEMGYAVPVDPTWSTEHAVENLISLMTQYGVDGGSFWRWTHFSNRESGDLRLADPVKRRGAEFVYTPVQKEILDMGGFHLTEIPNGSFESGSAIPDHWTIRGNGTGLRYHLADESGQPEVLSRGDYALRLTTGPDLRDKVRAQSQPVAVSPNTSYTTTARLRFAWSGDPAPSTEPRSRPHVFVLIQYSDESSSPFAERTQDGFRFYQENATRGFDTFVFQYVTPSDAAFLQIEVGIARNGLPTRFSLDVDALR